MHILLSNFPISNIEFILLIIFMFIMGMYIGEQIGRQSKQDVQIPSDTNGKNIEHGDFGPKNFSVHNTIHSTIYNTIHNSKNEK